MALSVLRMPTIICQQYPLPKNGPMHNRSRGTPLLSLGNPNKKQLVSNCGSLKCEVRSSNIDERHLEESDEDSQSLVTMSQAVIEEEETPITEMGSSHKQNETLMLSIAPLPYLIVAALPGAETVMSVFGPFAELVKTWNLPDWLVHWGHPGNMAVVLFAMGGYGSYLGWQIRLSEDVEVKAKAKDLHPKLLGGMFFFFALGATGGITSLLTQGKSIFESPHAVTGLIGLTLLTIQTVLPTLFEGNPNLRNVHGFLGSGIMMLFLIHSILGLQLGLSI